MLPTGPEIRAATGTNWVVPGDHGLGCGVLDQGVRGKRWIPGQQVNPSPIAPSIPMPGGVTTTPSLQVTPQFSSASYIFGVTLVLRTPPSSNAASFIESPPTWQGLLGGEGDSGIKAPSSFNPQEANRSGIPGPLPDSEMQPRNAAWPNPRI